MGLLGVGHRVSRNVMVHGETAVETENRLNYAKEFRRPRCCNAMPAVRALLNVCDNDIAVFAG